MYLVSNNNAILALIYMYISASWSWTQTVFSFSFLFTVYFCGLSWQTLLNIIVGTQKRVHSVEVFWRTGQHKEK